MRSSAEDVCGMPKAIFQILEFNISHGGGEDAKAQYTPLIKQSLVPAMQKHSFECLKRLGARYEEMIANLAAILPVTAYYLREKIIWKICFKRYLGILMT